MNFVRAWTGRAEDAFTATLHRPSYSSQEDWWERLERNSVFGHLLLPKARSAWFAQLYTVKPRVQLLCGVWRVAYRCGLKRDSSKWPEKSGLFVLLLIRLRLRVTNIHL
jgi:hypothetical protein